VLAHLLGPPRTGTILGPPVRAFFGPNPKIRADRVLGGVLGPPVEMLLDPPLNADRMDKDESMQNMLVLIFICLLTSKAYYLQTVFLKRLKLFKIGSYNEY
jgi:hypothetical protein